MAGAIAAKLHQMAEDAAWYARERAHSERETGACWKSPSSLVTPPWKRERGPARHLAAYLNNYHYNRNTRPHLYWLGFCTAPRDLKRLETLNFGTYWQNARDEERIDLDPSIADDAIREAIDEVRVRNPDKGVYGGRGWANYAAQYFNDCARFLDGAAWCLRPGATAWW